MARTTEMRRVYSSEMPSYQYKLLIWWAFCDRKTKTALSKDILVARAEANQPLIVGEKLPDYAQDFGVTTEQLMDLLLEADACNFSNLQLHDLLSSKGFEAAKQAVAKKAKSKKDES